MRWPYAFASVRAFAIEHDRRADRWEPVSSEPGRALGDVGLLDVRAPQRRESFSPLIVAVSLVVA